MHAKEENKEEFKHLGIAAGAMKLIFGSLESLFVYDTYQFDDYSKYVSGLFDPVLKAKKRDEEFPKDCKIAFELGAKLVQQANSLKDNGTK